MSLSILLCYWVNLYQFKNPFYPLHGFWIQFFDSAQFDESWDITFRKSLYNIDLGNALIEFIYVPIYATLGFGTTFWDFLPYIIHPAHKGVSIGWANPILLMMFILPFLLPKNNKVIRFLFILYFILYFFWFLNIQYTRIFFAETALLIFIFIVICSKIESNKLTQLTLTVSLMIITVFVVYHTLYTYIRMPIKMASIYSERARHQANLKYYNFMRNTFSTDYLDISIKYEEISKINKFMKTLDKPIVKTNIPIGIHMFFKYGQFLNKSGIREDCNLTTQSYINNKLVITKIFLKSEKYIFFCY